MTDTTNIPGITDKSLVLYKNGLALVQRADAKIHLVLLNGKEIAVRHKDVELLHPGPSERLHIIGEKAEKLEGEVDAACEMLAGEQTTIAEFSELAFEQWTPVSAWAVVLLLQDALVMTGRVWSLYIRTEEEKSTIIEERTAKEREQHQWEALLKRIQKKRLEPGDAEKFFDVENVAYGLSYSSRILKALGIKEDQEHAHE
nr:hypothetical protein [Spirochaetales bacterium]